MVGIDAQPLAAQAQRVAQALELRGAPLTGERRAKLDAALKAETPLSRVTGIQSALDPLCLAVVNINPESRVKVEPGPAARELWQHGWRVFLVKVHNEAGVTAPLRVSSPNALNMLKTSTAAAKPAVSIPPEVFEQRWLELAIYDDQPLGKTLSGFDVEYRVVELYSRDLGKREAKLEFDVGQGTQDLGFRNELSVLFTVQPSVEVTLDIIDHDGKPTTGQFVFTDEQGRVYPAKARRVAPDLYFHDQVYRHHGEHVLLPPGKYKSVYTRGPEYRVLEREITVPVAKTHRESFRLQRWIKLADLGWYSGDHHVHAAGCKHYESPSEGVQPADMMRHILGEDLNVGCVLSWGPCWYYQKQFFDGKIHKLSLPSYLMRYDVEVSGFPSSHAGHLCLLRLKEDDYPGTSTIEEWPSWDLPVLKWGKEQGGVVGFSHSGWGLQVPATKLPTLDMPKFDGIGANEYVVDTVHGVCDFISTVDTPSIWELNVWYHTLNCGMTTRISGETDFPCIYGERVGLGRSYVKLDPQAGLDYDRWADGIRDGRCYVSDGLGHLLDFTVNGLGVGEAGSAGRKSVLAAKSGEPLKVNVRAAALLAEKPRDEIRSQPLDKKPYWHVERARVGNSRQVPVELIVNGHAVEQKMIDADGDLDSVSFEYRLKFSSWVAVRIFPSAHTNPVFVEVDNKPIRASKSSAQWCLEAVDICWQQKQAKIRESERAAAVAAYDVARDAYRKVLAEANDD
ncbi:MAG: CehA/McbA family metallohydrolase [Planctomycetaceae bacterium]|nr:CehA/McbA family metallohydrolase [Planctomycetaceae bacterium]